MTSYRGQKGVNLGQKYTKICVLIFLTLLPSFIEIDSKMADLGRKKSFWGSLAPYYDVIEGSKRGEFGSKNCQNLCFNILDTFAKFHWD